MSDPEAGGIHNATPGGVSGTQPVSEPFQFLVAPSDLNVARLRLIPIACFRVDDIRFRFDSSFILFDTSSDTKTSGPKDIRAEMEEFARLVKANPGSPLSIFAHADPVGTDDYNKVLSGRRAKTIFGMLTRDTDMWESLFSGPKTIAGDNWGNDSLQIMQSATGLPGNIARTVLFKAYMDSLCGSFRLTKKDFLGQGADSGGKGDFQGCGEFNPVLIFSQAKQQEFEEAKEKQDQSTLDRRNSENAPNRRVMILLFRPGSKIDPAKWPCPRATEGVAGCKKRFFSDGEKRRSTRQASDNRKFEDAQDTFACRFYQRISGRSPCESLGGGRIRILLDDPFLGFLQDVSVKVTYASGTSETIVADKNAAIGVLVDRGNFADLEFKTSLRNNSLRVFIVLAGGSTRAGAWQRLVNLGYVRVPLPSSEPPNEDALATAVAEFQATHGIDPTGSVDDSTAQAIKQSHDLTVAWKDEQRTELPDALAADSASLPKDSVA
jgi:hypothetical protein